MAPVRQLLAGDEAMIRAGVRAVLASDDGIEVVAESADGRQAAEIGHPRLRGRAGLTIASP